MRPVTARAINACLQSGPQILQNPIAKYQSRKYARPMRPLQSGLYERLLNIQNAADLRWPETNADIGDQFRLNILPSATPHP